MYREFKVAQGTDWFKIVPLKDIEGDVVDLSGVTVLNSQMRRSFYSATGTTIGVSVTGTTTGTIQLSLGNAVTTPLAPGKYVFDVEIVGATTGYIERVLEGVINLTPEVTK